ncbi:MAG: glycosyltransferase family protein, partial [Myxococcota bacterium]
MKILYGVVGEGLGHAIRSSVILEKLLADGHEVHVVVSGRAYDLLAARFPQVSRIWGLTMSVKDNELKRLGTVAKNLREAIKGFPSNVRQYFEVEAQFEPDLVISDFETWTWLFAMRHRLPLICVDNIQVIRRCTHSAGILQHPDVQNFRLAKSLVRAKAPNASHYVVTSFFFPPVRKKRTTLIPPILRQSILDASPTRGE